MLPPGERVRMRVVSIRLHYSLVSPNIIWLPWQCPLTNRKIWYRSIVCTQTAIIWCKDCKYRSIISGDIRLNTLVFLAVSCLQKFTNELCQLGSYCTEVHEIFTRYTGIIYAVNAHTEVPISHFVFATNVGSLLFFHEIGCHGN